MAASRKSGNDRPVTSKTPRKPDITPASIEALLEHYHSQMDAFNEAQRLKASMANTEKARQALLAGLNKPLTADDISKEDLILLIRGQNLRLGRTVRNRSYQLLFTKLTDSNGNQVLEDNRTVGLSYDEILATLAIEFPEASTSAACLRWYVVHSKDAWVEHKGEWPDLPQLRPRSKSKGSK